MSQAQVANNEGITETVLLMVGTAADELYNICCIKTACSAATASGYSSYTQSAAAGLTEVSADTVTASSSAFANDTWCIAHPFTAGATEAVLGFIAANSSGDALYGVCCFAGVVNMEISDTLTCTMKGTLSNT